MSAYTDMDGKITLVVAISCIFVFLAEFIDLRNTLLKQKFRSETNGSESSRESNWLRDWHNYAAIKADLKAKGLGQAGRPANIEEYRIDLYKEYGYDAMLSDYIHLNRSVPDVRPENCKNQTHVATLPKTAIIIIFFNERRSVLLRTVIGIINRSPDELIQEILLVDDCSTYEELIDPLSEYLRTNLPTERSKVRLIRSPKRGGLMVARMMGARAASKESEVLIFMDSHFEVNYNWLPPLLEPIALNPKVCTSPGLDRINFLSFEYTMGNPFRGYFDWRLNFYFHPVHRREYATPAKNRPEYVLMGASIAIGADFFWELGGFDEGMELWGGEQFEFSFKIWMCGGEIITVPCSRMAHVYRDPNTKGNTNLYGNYNFVDKNYRRFIDVWMDDEHREIVFNRRPSLKDADPGNLTDRFIIRDRLQCKSFSWMLDNKMTDLKEKFPPVEPHDLASGLWRSLVDPTLCIALANDKRVVLEPCPIEETGGGNKHWIYTWRGEIRGHIGICLESDIIHNRVNSWECHGTGGNQRWYYCREKLWIVQEEYNMCMAASIEDRLVRLYKCDESDLSMKWIVTHMNFTEMDLFEYKLRWRLDLSED